MSIKPISAESQKTYISKFDTDEPKTEWIIGAISPLILAKIDDEAMQFEQGNEAMESGGVARYTININQQRILYFKYGVRGIKSGNTFGFNVGDDGTIPDHIMKKIPKDVIYEIGDVVRSFNSLSKEDIALLK